MFRDIWRLGIWNVGPMVDTEGPTEVATVRARNGEKIVQETKWFGCEVYYKVTAWFWLQVG